MGGRDDGGLPCRCTATVRGMSCTAADGVVGGGVRRTGGNGGRQPGQTHSTPGVAGGGGGLRGRG